MNVLLHIEKMRFIFYKFSWATFIMLSIFLIPINTFCQESFKEKYNLEFVATPLVMFNPNFGNGAGAMAMALFDMNPEDENLQPSAVAVTGLYSDRKSHIIGLGGSFFPNRDFRYKAGIGNGNIKSELDIDLIPGTADFSTNFNAVFLEGQYHFAENFFAGLKTIVSWIAYSPDNAAGDAFLKLMDAEDTNSASVGPVVSYDTRDNRFFPYSGIFSEVSFMYNAEALGSDVNYYILEGALNGYRQFRPGHVIGGRLYGRFTPSQTPYPGLSTLGKRSDLRGYVAGEHVANNLVSIQGEYRWNFYKRWWIIGFLGQAALFDKGDLNSDSFFTSVGGGLRYTLSEERRVKIRVDFAWGEGNSDGFYVGLSEAF